MPKSKIRSRHNLNHYNEYAGMLVGKQKQNVYGKGSKKPIKKRSEYMGSFITPGSRREYMKKHTSGFVKNLTKDFEDNLEKVKADDKLTDEQKEKKLKELESKKLDEKTIELLSKRSARYQSNKEQKHYKAWLKGKDYYQYKGGTFPVITERFLKDSKSIKDIIKVEEDGEGTNSQ